MSAKPHGRPELGKLVERQMRNWELSRAQRVSYPTKVEPRGAPFVAISRSFGCGGSDVARLLGQRLNWPVFDRELLQTMAGDDQVRARLYEHMDERDTNWMESTLQWLLRGELRKDDFFYQLSETVLAIHRQGPAVFLGRGADLILPHAAGLRVRLDAPLEHRTTCVAQREGVTAARALDLIEQRDSERESFRRRHFGRSACEHGQHDLCVNTASFGAAAAVEVIVAALRTRGIAAS
jgi:hypothetical protein